MPCFEIFFFLPLMLTFYSGPPRKRVRQDNTSGPFTQQEQLQEQEHRSLAQSSQLNETVAELPLSSSGAAGNSQGSVEDAPLPAGAALSDAPSQHHTVSLQPQPQLQLHEPDASAPAPGVHHGPSHQDHSEHDGAGDAGQQDPGRDHLGIDMPRGDEILGMFIASVFVVRVTWRARGGPICFVCMAIQSLTA